MQKHKILVWDNNFTEDTTVLIRRFIFISTMFNNETIFAERKKLYVFTTLKTRKNIIIKPNVFDLMSSSGDNNYQVMMTISRKHTDLTR